DMISMARPFLADPDLMKKAQDNKAEEINTCIGCNQACLDHIFKQKTASCLVNPQACHETFYSEPKTSKKKNVSVIGAGPAGLSAACYAAELGHHVDLYEASGQIGGQFNLARAVPGKEEFDETIRYFENRLKKAGVNLHLNTPISTQQLQESNPDEIIVATGVQPRALSLEGANHIKVKPYDEVIQGQHQIGEKVAVVGAGGIGFDMCEFLLADRHQPTEEFAAEWGIDMEYQQPGGLMKPNHEASKKSIYLLQRKATKHGKGLGKTTGWIHRASLKKAGVEMLGGVEYKKVDDQGLHILVSGEPRVLAVDDVVVCAGQTSVNQLYEDLKAVRENVHLIGGALLASEIDAKRAIEEGMKVAYAISE
ncbi:MAG: FAD-dependent oxidoreductase, partial [Bacteroidota bacterium]